MDEDVAMEVVSDPETGNTDSQQQSVAKVEEEQPQDSKMEVEDTKEEAKEDQAKDDDDASVASNGTSSTGSDDDKPAPKEDPEILLVKAATLKEEGNNYFKEKDFEKAARAYRRGTNALKPLNKANSGDEQVKNLLMSLQTNLSMMCFKMSKFKQSVSIASKVLQIDSTNVKARYRRAAAHRKMGNHEEARNDLKEALKTDANNTAVKKELLSIKQELEAIKAVQKKSMAKAFASKGGSFLYDDKEEEKKRKDEQKKLENQRQEEEKKKRKVQWEDECVKRMAKGEKVVSFEDWEKEQKKKAKAARKKAEGVERQRKEEQRKMRRAAKTNDSDSEDEQLTEAEMAQFRGYKKTTDGRVTSYFSREQSAEEKDLIGNIAPKRLEENGENVAPTTGNAVGSAWNQAGTWEERDASEWCRNKLQSRLQETKAESSGGNSMVAKVVKVDDMGGDASVAVVGGKKRYIFDFHCKLDFEIQDSVTSEVLASGSVNLPDICSAHHEELEVTTSAWKVQPSNTNAEAAANCRHALCSEVRESVKLWVQDFNEAY